MNPTSSPTLTCPSVLVEASHDPCDGWTYKATADLEINVTTSCSVEASIVAGPARRPQDALADLMTLCTAAGVVFKGPDRPTSLWWFAYPTGTCPDGLKDVVAETAATNGWVVD